MIITPPNNICIRNHGQRSVFLAGSIEMGKAENWQNEMSLFFDKEHYNVFNPRRDEWDSSWEQSTLNPQFYQQVMWELEALETADYIFMYLAPGTISPISLMELGLHANDKITVVCPDGFERKGNVEIVCQHYNIPMFDSIEAYKKHFFARPVKYRD